MTPKQFQDVHGPWLASILSDPKGQALLGVLASLQPPFPESEIPHLFAKGLGKREGFESCIKTIVALSIPPKIQSEVEADYGIKTEETK